jgi:hypothetical protein
MYVCSKDKKIVGDIIGTGVAYHDSMVTGDFKSQVDK